MGPVSNTHRLDDRGYRNKSARIRGETQTARVYSSSDSQDPMAWIVFIVVCQVGIGRLKWTLHQKKK